MLHVVCYGSFLLFLNSKAPLSVPLSLFCCRLSCWSCSFSISETSKASRVWVQKDIGAVDLTPWGSIAGLPPH